MVECVLICFCLGHALGITLPPYQRSPLQRWEFVGKGTPLSELKEKQHRDDHQHDQWADIYAQMIQNDDSQSQCVCVCVCASHRLKLMIQNDDSQCVFVCVCASRRLQSWFTMWVCLCADLQFTLFVCCTHISIMCVCGDNESNSLVIWTNEVNFAVIEMCVHSSHRHLVSWLAEIYKVITLSAPFVRFCDCHLH